MLSLSAGSTSYSLPVSPSEMTVLVELARFTIPRALCFDRAMEVEVK